MMLQRNRREKLSIECLEDPFVDWPGSQSL